MSLLINDMDMPKNCFNCEMYGVMKGCCGLTDGRFEHPLQKRRTDCPLSEIPTPHGDLIDRDDLLTYFDRKAKGKTAEEALKLLYTALKAYPAVIGKEMNQ